jgi:hypothetical protein
LVLFFGLHTPLQVDCFVSAPPAAGFKVKLSTPLFICALKLLLLLLLCKVDVVVTVVVCVKPFDAIVDVFDCVGSVVDVDIVDAFTAADAAATAAAATDALLLLLFIFVKLFNDDVNEPDAAKFVVDSVFAISAFDVDCIYTGIRRPFNKGCIVSSIIDYID